MTHRRDFTQWEKVENIRHAALWVQPVANAELVFLFSLSFYMPLSMTLVLFIGHILPFL